MPSVSRPFQEQLARLARSLDLAAVPFLSFASWTRDSIVLAETALQGSGSFSYATFSSAVEPFVPGLDEEDDEDFLPESEPEEDFPESEEQPATVRITGTAAQARTRVRREADRCMVPSDVGDISVLRGRASGVWDPRNGSPIRSGTAVRAVTRAVHAPREQRAHSLKRSARASAS